MQEAAMQAQNAAMQKLQMQLALKEQEEAHAKQLSSVSAQVGKLQEMEAISVEQGRIRSMGMTQMREGIARRVSQSGSASASSQKPDSPLKSFIKSQTGLMHLPMETIEALEKQFQALQLSHDPEPDVTPLPFSFPDNAGAETTASTPSFVTAREASDLQVHPTPAAPTRLRITEVSESTRMDTPQGVMDSVIQAPVLQPGGGNPCPDQGR